MAFTQYSDTFRRSVNSARERSLAGAMDFLNNAPTTVDRVAAQQAGNDSLDAFKSASRGAAQGLNQINTFGSSLNDSLAGNANKGMFNVGKAAAHEQRMDAMQEQTKLMEQAQQQQEASGIFGTALNIAGAALSFCERRLKLGITAIDPQAAWDAVKRIPHYSFRYRHSPQQISYGPIVDEVERIDPTLLAPMDEQAAALGIADGLPIRGLDQDRRNAYESVALQVALQRIEDLERRLAVLEGRPQLALAA